MCRVVRMTRVTFWAGLCVVLLTVSPAHAGPITNLSVMFEDPDRPGESGTISDGGAFDGDNVVNRMLRLKQTGPFVIPGSFSYTVEAIDPAKPIVTGEGTANSVKLVLTNLRIVAADDFAKGQITFALDWAHDAGEGPMMTSLGGEFGPGPGPGVDDRYSVTFGGNVAGNALTVGPLTGPPPNQFGDQKTKGIVLVKAADKVSGTLTFELDRVSSTLTFPDSAEVAATVPEPGPLLLLAGGLAGLLGRAYRHLRR